MFLLDYIPFVNVIQDVLGLLGIVQAVPTPEGILAKLASTVVVLHIVSPYAEKFVDYTNTEFDNKIWDVVSTVLGVCTKVLVALGKLDPNEVKKAVMDMEMNKSK